MDFPKRKRKVTGEGDSFATRRHVNLLNDHDSHAVNVYSLEECGQQQSKRRKEAGLASNNFVSRKAATVPFSRKGCLPDKPLRGLKRKIGCIDSATQFGRNRKFEVDYELGPVLGQGKFGLVRLCRNKATGEVLACKTLPKKTEENVHREVEIMQHLSGHRNVVTLCALYEDEDCLHLVMEFCSNGRLVDEISKCGRYTEHQAARLLKELMVVINYCHEMGVVHRDIKPENILRSSAGQLKLADFGLSMRIAKGQRMRGVVGSPAYVAPEVLDGAYTEKVDVWAAGVILHVLLIGKLPFKGDSVEEIFKATREVTLDFKSGPWQAISSLGRDLISKMLSKNAEKRLSPVEVLSHPWITFYTESLEAGRLTRKKHKINVHRLKIGESLPKAPLTGWQSKKGEESSGSLEDLPLHIVRQLKLTKKHQPNIQTAADIEIVDALATAISKMRVSEPKRIRVCLTTFPVAEPCSPNIKVNLCKAF